MTAVFYDSVGYMCCLLDVQRPVNQSTRDVSPVLGQRWLTVYAAGPALRWRPVYVRVMEPSQYSIAYLCVMTSCLVTDDQHAMNSR